MIISGEMNFSKDKYNDDLRDYERKLNDARRQKERVEEKLMQTHQRSPSPLKKRSWGQKLIGKITKKSVVDRTSKRKSDRAISEVTLKSGLLESDGYGSAEVSLKQPSENTLEGSISSSQSLNEPKVIL